MTVLQTILLVTALAGTASVLVAATFSVTLLARMVNNMVSLSVGILLATALLHSLPEAFSIGGVSTQLLLPLCWLVY